MPKQSASNADFNEPLAYQIRLRGYLGAEWADWFEGLTITLEEGGDTLIAGPVADQAALHGLLRKVRNLGMPLISVSLVSFRLSPAQGSDRKTLADGGNRPNKIPREEK